MVVLILKVKQAGKCGAMLSDSDLLTRRSDCETIKNWERFLRDCDEVKNEIWHIIRIQQTLYYTFQTEIEAKKFENSYAGHAYFAIKLALIDSLAMRVWRIWDKATDANSLVRCKKALDNPKIRRLLRRQAALDYLHEFREAINGKEYLLARLRFGGMKAEAKSVDRQTQRWLRDMKESEKSKLLKSLSYYRNNELAHSLDEISRKTRDSDFDQIRDNDVVQLAFGSICLAHVLISLAMRSDCLFDVAISISKKNAKSFWENQPRFADVE